MPLKYNPATRRLNGPKATLQLSPNSSRAWELLQKHEVLHKEVLYAALYGMREEPVISRNIDIVIHRLRKRVALVCNKTQIRTIWGVGWTLEL